MKLNIANWICGPLLAALFFTQQANAIEFIQRDQFISSSAETLRNETWVSAQTITISGEVLDDLFAAGTTLDLRGKFNGDVWAIGDQVITDGRFNDDLRLMARTAQISGTIKGSLTAMGTTIKVDPAAVIAKDLYCTSGTGNVICEGTVKGNVHILANRATLGGRISGDVSITAQDIVILPDTVIDGDLIYTAPGELVLASSVTLNGYQERKFAPLPEVNLITPNLPLHVGFAVAALLTGLFFCSIFPVYTARTLHLLNTAYGPCLLTGSAALCLIPICAFLLLLTVVGIPLSLLLVLFYIILLYLGKITVGLWIGALILRRKALSKRNLSGTLAAGLLVIYALTAINPLAWMIGTMTALFGMGAMLLALFKKPVFVIQTPPNLTQKQLEG